MHVMMFYNGYMASQLSLSLSLSLSLCVCVSVSFVHFIALYL